MIKLVEPHKKYLKSYAEACKEYQDYNVSDYHYSDPAVIDVLAKFANYRNETDLPTGMVGSHYFWLVDDEKDYFIGEIAIRHRLNAALERLGGHIGYGIRPAQWNKGYGTLMLKLALIEAKKLGITKILITCNDKNCASARVMEKNGFVLADKIPNSRNGKDFITRRYWKTI